MAAVHLTKQSPLYVIYHKTYYQRQNHIFMNDDGLTINVYRKTLKHGVS
jgi:hypothetical protein